MSVEFHRDVGVCVLVLHMDLSMHSYLCLLGGARELKEPDALAGACCFRQAIGVWLSGLVGKGLQMSLVAFLCVSAPEGQSASWPFSYTLVGAKELDTCILSLSPALALSISLCFVNNTTD